MEKVIDCVPGLKDVRIKDLPFRAKGMLEFPMKEVEEAVKAAGIIINSFEGLEEDVLGGLSIIYPQVYTIGPLQMLLKSTLLGCDPKPLRSSLWEERHECLEWLDSMEPNSVVYISFGSLLNPTLEKLSEFALGILSSNYAFLWMMRNDPTDSDLLMKLRKRGFITSWCPQESVLNHPAVGGFITHGGWNSMLDSICAGVPVICCPFWGDQAINSRYSCTSWGIGLHMDFDSKRDEVEKAVRELMGGDRGIEMKEKVTELMRLAAEAVGDGGSSSLDLEKLLSCASNCCDGGSISMEEKLQDLVAEAVKSTT